MEIKVYKDACQTALHVAAHLAEMVENGGGTIALSGGSTPGVLFRMLPEKYSGVPWKNATFFWVDERMVPAQSTESNYGEFYRSPGMKNMIPRTNIFETVYDKNTEKALLDVENKLRNQVAWSNGLPQFDLILLGVGEDGHTASIFPDHLSSFSSGLPVEMVLNPYTLQQRITLTGSTINNARQVLFLCTGRAKAEVVEKILIKKDKTLPAAHVAPRGELIWYLDKEAAHKLHALDDYTTQRESIE